VPDLRDDVDQKRRRAAEMKTIVCFAAVLATNLCSAASLDESFNDVSGTVLSRTGKRVQWNQGTPQDAKAEAYVRSLLKRSLTPNSAVQIALLNNHDLQATYEEIGIAQADVIEAGLLRNPLFSIERRFPGQALEAELVTEFVDILFLPLRKRAAKAQLEAAKSRVGNEILKIASEVRAAVYEHQGNLQLGDLGVEVEKAAAASAEAALQLHQAGNIRDLDLANEEAMHVQAKLDLAKGQALAIDTREKLNKLIGAWGEQTDWTIAPRLPDPAKNEIKTSSLESRAIEQRLDLTALRYEALGQAQRLGFARVQAVAQQFEIGGRYVHEIQSEHSTGPIIRIPIPLFDFGQGVKARGEARLRQLQQRYLGLAVQIRSDVRAVRDRMLNAREIVEYSRTTVLPLRHRVVEESQLQYNAMQISLFDLLRAKQEEVNVGRQSVEAQRDYWVARAELEKAVGGSLNGKLLQLSESKEIVHGR
jgi:cobalt-zinc-cadmium efflux system outer membrane protein